MFGSCQFFWFPLARDYTVLFLPDSFLWFAA
jgi:hypothetical protein